MNFRHPPRRLIEILGFTVPLLLLAVGFNFLLGVLNPGGARVDSPGENAFVVEMKERVQEAEAWYREGRVMDDRPLCVIFGLSTVKDGIHVDILGERDGIECRYLFLGGAGGEGLSDFAAQIEPLLESPLRPDLVCLGINTFFFAIPPGDPDRDERGVKEAGASDAARDSGLPGGLHEVSWVVRHRSELSARIDGILKRGRQWLMEKERSKEGPFGQPSYTPHLAVAAGRGDRDRFRERGFYDLKNYTENFGSSMALLVPAIQQLQAKGSRVAVILMPEVEEARISIPSEVRTLLYEAIQTHFPGDSVPILDLSAVLPDIEFYDHAHANEFGRIRLSEELAREIPGLLPEDSPLPRLAGAEPAGRP